MGLYKYKARTAAGEKVEGTFEVASQDAVITLLKSRGMYPLEIGEADITQGRGFGKKNKSVKTRDLIVFFRQFHTMVRAGLNIVHCLDLLRKQTEDVFFASIISKIYDDVNRGISMSDGMRKYPRVFPPLSASMVEIGEVSGTLELILDRISIFIEKENKMKQKLKSAMTYPMIIASISLLAVVGMLFFIVPRFVQMFASMGSELPLPTKILIAISEGIKNPLTYLIAVPIIFVGILAVRNLLKDEKVRLKWDEFILKIPLIGKNLRKILATRMTRSLGLMLRSGVSLVQCIEVCARLISNSVVKKGLMQSKEDVLMGVQLSKSLEKVGIFPIMMIHMIAIGEESGSLEDIIDKVGDYYDEEVDNSLSRMLSIIEPLMIFGLALVIGGIVIAMILPIFSMYQKVGK